MILAVKRFVFWAAPNLGLALAKLTSRPRSVELKIVEAVAPRDRLAIDVGASWGLYTFLLQRCASAVVAFEPNPQKAKYLREFFRNSNVVVHQMALSDSPGEVELIVPAGASAFATIETKNPLWSMNEKVAARIRVTRQTLADFSFSPIGFVKIDVEGHEYSVLSGARALLLRDKPILYIRIERRHNPNEFGRTFKFLSDLDYCGYFSDGPRLTDIRFFAVERDQPPQNVDGDRFVGRYIYNFLFMPLSEIGDTFAKLRKAGFDVPADQTP